MLGRYWLTWNWSPAGTACNCVLPSTSTSLNRRAKTSEGLLAGSKAGPPPDQVTTKSPALSMATSGRFQVSEAVVLTTNSGTITVLEELKTSARMLPSTVQAT